METTINTDRIRTALALGLAAAGFVILAWVAYQVIPPMPLLAAAGLGLIVSAGVIAK